MCGRYLFFDQSNPKMNQFIQQVKKKMPEEQFEKVSLFEVFPSQNVINLIYSSQTKKFQVCMMHWGFQGFADGKLIINARSETADTSSYFKGTQRCIIPCCGYYEWSPAHQKYYFSCETPPFYLAGLCKEEKNEICFVILTEEAQMPEREIHPRQPVIFDSMHAKMWLENEPYKRMLSASLQNRTMSKV